MNTTKALIAGAAVAGLMAGSLPVAPIQQHLHPSWSLSPDHGRERRASYEAECLKARVAASPVTRAAKEKHLQRQGGCATDGKHK